ncbi:sulfur oxidation c-type cytochrome SoxA [Alisedimentitalea sp. MJ-SS2]|uniref:sulfur oxidation c-type cytochrome SoxA n=1 Tax=Aliisedimentitalea sp. MJ-SS2 TaxID=3049795 RepID=UPI00291547B4|nr:sulfur oxidation c-type cytochrome SoxA [Alisedimentitalea sp. MJ-SS2]MDU8929072.1 sulfur oxidation c-type cytochrome SoxA [Alisedimentitalea sp. MJ-SS2]
MKFKTMSLVAAVAVALPTFAIADADDDKLVVNGDMEMVTKTKAAAHLDGALDEAISGWHFRSDETQALQADDFDNPGMIYVDQAMDDWVKVEGSEGKSCASCHDDPAESMKGVRAVYPKWNEETGKLHTLQTQINHCRTERMGAEPLKYAKTKINRMEAMISSHSRGMPVNVAIDGPVADIWAKGKEMYYTRFGQLELSCASCHEENYGNHIRSDHLSQGQINGFPVYRLKNAKLTSAQARFKGCIRDTRAETFSPNSDEFHALELYVTSRGNGLSVEGPSVRN